MRNISFSLTADQIIGRTKTVTRRLGWQSLRRGELLSACRKCQGLKPGEKVERLATIRVVQVSRERLDAICMDIDYGFVEVQREGFGGPPINGFPSAFVDMFCDHMGCKPSQTVTRIAFEYV